MNNNIVVESHYEDTEIKAGKKGVVKDATYWHGQALKADKMRSSSSLKHAEALYFLNEDGGYKELGFKSMAKYVYANFGKSKSWGDKLIKVYSKFYVTLEADPDTLEEVGFGKLAKLVSVVNSGNFEEILEDAKKKTQQEIDLKIKEDNGLEPNEVKVDDEISRITFKGPKDFADQFNTILKIAKKEWAEEQGVDESNVMDFQGLEMILANYNLTRHVSGDLMDDLENLLDRVGKAYKIKISYEIGETDE